MQEIWKDVVGFEKILEVSNLGRVRSKERYVNCNGGTKLLKPKIRKGSDNGTGYLQYAIQVDNEIVKKYGHVMVAEAFIDNPLNLPQIHHKNHIKSDNRAFENLEWVTRSENLTKYHEFNGSSKKKHLCDCGREKFKTSDICMNCYSEKRLNKSNRPSKDELEILIKTKSFIDIGKDFGVSDNAVRKWCKSYGLPYKKKDVKVYFENK